MADVPRRLSRLATVVFSVGLASFIIECASVVGFQRGQGHTIALALGELAILSAATNAVLGLVVFVRVLIHRNDLSGRGLAIGGVGFSIATAAPALFLILGAALSTG